MKIHARVVFPSTLLAIVLAAGTAAGGEDLVDRRGAARGAFRADPKGLFAHYCAHCHGADGKGNGRLWATGLAPKPANLVALEADKEYLEESIRDGSRAHGKSALCPPWGRTISRSDIDRLAHFLLSWRGAPKAVPEESVAPPGEAFPLLLVLVLVAELIVLLRLVVLRRRAPLGEG